jgi:hypothetical protein
MAADLWVLRDANWSPDFPTSADVARALYAQDQGIETDGAVALDLEAVRLLVGAVGPLTVPGVAEPITGANALQWMKSAWENPTAAQGADGQPAGDWWAKRKDFMGELVKAALAKLQGGGDLDAIALARALYASLDGRHLQAAVDDPDLAALLAQRGWDGGLRLPERSDFLGVVDSNVGFNKANSFVREALDYRVEDVQGGLEATLTITYIHGAPAGAETICDRTAGYGPDYGSLSARCYWDYLRVYTAPDAELIESSGLNNAATEPGEAGATVFTGDFVLKPGDVQVVKLRYRLPASLAPGTNGPYQLFVRKQAGASDLPLVVSYDGCTLNTTVSSDVRFSCPPGGPEQAAGTE